MGTKNLWVLCVSMCLGMFGVYSCGDDDELENERRNSPQEENVEKDTLQEQTDGSDTMAVVSDSTQVIPADTLPDENVRYELEDMLIGKWEWRYNGGHMIPYETYEYGFNADHSGYVSYYYYANNGGSHSMGEYIEDEINIDVDFSWEVLSEKVFSIHSVSANISKNGSSSTSSYEGSVKYQLDKVSSDSLFFYGCGPFRIKDGYMYFSACDGEPTPRTYYPFTLHGKR